MKNRSVRKAKHVDSGSRSKGRTSNAQRGEGRRVKEELDADSGRKSKGETFNVQRSTFNAQRGKKRRVKEEPGVDYGRKPKRETSNVQRGGNSGTSTYDLEERLLEYAVRIIRLVDALPPTRAGRHVADQLLRCGTSPLGNHDEVQGAESRKDFIHKLRICFKELREARRWLRLVHRVPLVTPSKVEPLLIETEALIKIFSASIRTAEKNKK